MAVVVFVVQFFMMIIVYLEYIEPTTEWTNEHVRSFTLFVYRFVFFWNKSINYFW